MREWTKDAEVMCENYLNRVEQLCLKQGDDADDVVDGLREHIVARVTEQNPTLVTAELINRILTELGTPEQVTGSPDSLIVKSNDTKDPDDVDLHPKRFRLFRWRLPMFVSWTSFIIFAVIIPIASIIMELAFHPLSDIAWDPIPTWGHVIMLFLVPLGLLFTGVVSQNDASRNTTILAFLVNGYTLTIAAIYLICFLPTMPLMVLAIIALGIGLLGLTPFWCTWASIKQMIRLYRLRSELHVTLRLARIMTLCGVILGCCVLLSLELDGVVVRYAETKIIDGNLDEQASGLRLIRLFNAEDRVLAQCYGTRSRSPRNSPTRIRNARKVYYRLTGTPFNSVPRPNLNRPQWKRFEDDGLNTWRDDFTNDNEIGGTAVAGVVKDLDLYSSNMDLSISADEANSAGQGIAYLEWTLEFHNGSHRQREARCQIQLPPDAVASRLNLWIDGEERDAAFGARSTVREAYQEIAVRQRRDPALLTTAGPNRLLLQCFPVQPGKQMKVKIGFTIPLYSIEDTACVVYPKIIERNFAIPPELTHAIWIESSIPVTSSLETLLVEEAGADLFALRGKLTEQQLQNPGFNYCTVTSPPPTEHRYYNCVTENHSAWMELSSTSQPVVKNQKICFVIDGSGPMEDPVTDVAWSTVLQSIDATVEVNAIFAGDVPIQWKTISVPADLASTELPGWIKGQRYVGGQDSIPALEMAWDICESADFGTVIWVASQHPLVLSSEEALLQRFQRRPMNADGSGVRLLVVPTLSGPNRILEAFTDVVGIDELAVIGSLDDTLSRVSANPQTVVQGDISRCFGYGEAQPDTLLEDTEVIPGSRHILRLAIADLVNRNIVKNNLTEMDSAADLAVEMRIVTPLTGAVVLERLEQYERHDLEPGANPQNIPNIPEPEEWLLIIVAAIGLAVLVFRAR